MAIRLASILLDATVSFTAGTAKSLTYLGNSLQEVKTFWNGTDLRTRYEIFFSVKTPSVKADAPNGYTQARCVSYMKFPKTLINGKVTSNTLQITFSTDVETTDAEKQTYLNAAGQILLDTDFSSFWKAQSLD